VEARWQPGDAPGTVQRLVAGDGEPEVILICGYFHASYGTSIDCSRRCILVDGLKRRTTWRELRSVLAELTARSA